MGEKIIRKVKGMSWTAKVSLMLVFTLMFSVFVYQGWYYPKKAHGAAITSTATGGLWNATTTWVGGVVPGAADTVTIANAAIVTVSDARSATSVTIAATGNANSTTLVIDPGITLTVSGAVTVNAPGTNGITNAVTVGSGTLSAGSLVITATTGTKVSQVTVSTGTITVGGNLTLSGSAANAQLTSTGASTITVNGAVSSVGTISLGSGTMNIKGNLSGVTIAANTGTFNFNGTSAQTVLGSANYNIVKVNNAAGVTLTAIATIPTLTIGDVTGSSVFSDGGFQVTSTGTLNLTSGTFKLGSATVATTFPGFTTRNISAGTTVEYASGIAQTVSGTPTYSNLTLSGAGIKTLGAATVVNGNLTISAGTLDVSINNYALTVKGNWTNNGTFTPQAGAVTFSGTGNQTINSANTWYGLAITGTTARTVSFQSSVAQTIAANGSLTLTGASGQLLTLAPLTAATTWLLNVNATATQSVSYVSVSYSNASGGTAIDATNGTNFNGGNNTNWNFAAAVQTIVDDDTSPGNKWAKASATNKAVSTFQLKTSSGTDTINSITVARTGGADADIAASGVKIWNDVNNDNEYDAGDTSVGSCTLSAGSCTVGSLSIAIDATAKNYVITYDISGSPTNGNTLQAAVTNITFASSNTKTINDNVDATITIDTAAPTTTATAGAYTFGTWTATSPVTITLSAGDGTGSGVASGYPKYCVDETDTCSPATSYTVPFDVTCAATCTQYVRYQSVDNAGNTETVKSSQVKQDLQGPASGASFTSTPGDSTCTLNWASTTDAGSGMHATEPYEVRWQLGSDPGSCSGGAQLYIGTALTTPHNGLTNGQTYYYRLCYKDAVLNQSGYTGNPITCVPSAVCTRNQPTLSISPASQTITTDGGSKDYTLAITNNDTGSCANETFNLSKTDSNSTNFNASTLSQPSVNLAPGGNTNVTLTVNAKAGETTGSNDTYVTAASANHADKNSNTVTTTINLVNPLLHNSVNLSSDKWSGVGGWGITGGKYGAFTCGTCHAPRATNIKGVKSSITTPDTSKGTLPGDGQTITFDRVSGTAGDPGLMGDDSAAPRASSNRICEVCHTKYEAAQTNGVTFHSYAIDSNPSHYNAEDCTSSCHKHNVAFSGAGGTCDGCHGATPSLFWTSAAHTKHFGLDEWYTAGYDDTNLSKPTYYRYNCNKCHETAHATAPQPNITFDGGVNPPLSSGGTYTAATKTCSNLYCHGNFTGGLNASPTWTGAAGCGTCHGVNASDPPGTVVSGSSSSHAAHITGSTLNLGCGKCHNTYTNNDTHVNGSADWYLDATDNRIGSGTYKGAASGTNTPPGTVAYGTCSTIYCHGLNTPTWGGAALACNGCHGATNNGDLSVDNLKGHKIHYNKATAPTALTQADDFTSSYAYGCQRCHPTTEHVDGPYDSAGPTLQDADISLTGKIATFTQGGSSTTDAKGFNYTVGSGCTTVCHTRTGVITDSPVTAALWSGAQTSPNCGVCHRASGDNYATMTTSPTKLSNAHAKHKATDWYGLNSNYTCNTCHSGTASSDTAINNTQAARTQHPDTNKDVAMNAWAGGSWSSPNCSSVYCHSSGEATPSYKSIAWTATTTCASCHNYTTASGTPITTGKHTLHRTTTKMTLSAYLCADCHVDTSATNNTVSSFTKHVNKVRDVTVLGTWDSNATTTDNYTVATQTCANVYCHSDGLATPTYKSIAWTAGATTCASCHNYTTASGAPITTGKHTVHRTTTKMTLSAYLCADCHVSTTASADTISTAALHIQTTKARDVTILGTWDSDATANNNYTVATQTCANVYCHSSGQATPVYQSVTWGAAAMTCKSCHGGTVAGGAPIIATGKHTQHINTTNLITTDPSCNACHVDTTADNSTIATASKHIQTTKARDVTILGTWDSDATTTNNYTVATQTCANVYCHSNGKTAGLAYNSIAWTAAITGCNVATYCHGLPPAGTTPFDHTGKTAATCITCHDHVNAAGDGFTVSSKHINKIVEAQVTCTGCHTVAQGTRRAVKGEFGLAFGHHDATVTDADCVVCHMEGTSVANPARSASHAGVPGGNIDLRDPDLGTAIASPAAIFARNVSLNTLEAFATSIQNNLCLKCHDANGANYLGAGQTGTDGLHTPSNPFVTGVAPVDVNAHFDIANSTFHPVKGTQNNDRCNQNTMLAPWNKTKTVGLPLEAGYLITCFDCHAKDGATGNQSSTIVAHGTNESDTLRATYNFYNPAAGSISAGPTNLCVLCHNTTVYYVGGAETNSAFGGTNDDDHARHGGVTVGAVCGSCHGSSWTDPGRPTRAEDAHGFENLVEGTWWPVGAGNTNPPYSFLRNTTDKGGSTYWTDWKSPQTAGQVSDEGCYWGANAGALCSETRHDGYNAGGVGTPPYWTDYEPGGAY